MSNKRFPKSYFKNRFNNNNLRLRQFKIDKSLIHKFIKNGKICDVGCSTGEFLYNIGWKKHAYGMEINKYAKKEAKKFINFNKNITNQKNYFDIVVFRGTIQHLDDPFNFLKNSYNSLKKGGWLILLSVPNANSILFKNNAHTNKFFSGYSIGFVPNKSALSDVKNSDLVSIFNLKF
jgi:2-polyprenyl-3-methyl-5-hydroxy-6-metoxy-1,4-benzoquinol methylase